MKKEWLSPLRVEYWRTAAAEYRSVRTLCIAAMFVAMHVALNFLTVPVGENLMVKLCFTADALCMTICGPAVGIAAGIASDLIGHFIHPMGAFFPGYTLSCVLGFLVYGIALYRRPITIIRIAAAKAFVNLFINVGLGCVWSSMLMGKGYLYFAAKSIVKNTILFPAETVILCLLIGALLPAMSRMGLIPPQKKLTFWSAPETEEKHEL